MFLLSFSDSCHTVLFIQLFKLVLTSVMLFAFLSFLCCIFYWLLQTLICLILFVTLVHIKHKDTLTQHWLALLKGSVWFTCSEEWRLAPSVRVHYQLTLHITLYLTSLHPEIWRVSNHWLILVALSFLPVDCGQFDLLQHVCVNPTPVWISWPLLLLFTAFLFYIIVDWISLGLKCWSSKTSNLRMSVLFSCISLLKL